MSPSMCEPQLGSLPEELDLAPREHTTSVPTPVPGGVPSCSSAALARLPLTRWDCCSWSFQRWFLKSEQLSWFPKSSKAHVQETLLSRSLCSFSFALLISRVATLLIFSLMTPKILSSRDLGGQDSLLPSQLACIPLDSQRRV